MLVSQKDYAQSRGVSKQYISKLVKNKVLVLHDGLIDEEEADTRLMSTRVVAKPSKLEKFIGSTGMPDPKSKDKAPLSEVLLRARIFNEQARAKMLAMQVQKEEGKLISADEVKVTSYNKARMVRDAFLNLPARVSSLLVNQQDAEVIHGILMKEIRQIVEEIINVEGAENHQ